jgi:TolB-like protein
LIVISLLCAAVILFAYDKWWTSGPTNKSIAVLAFKNMSGDPEQEYFSDGISEELLNLLAQIPELRVISRSSAFSFKDQDLPITVIAEQLNVAHVLEGSIRKVGNRVRITAQLIEASSDSHLWSQSYDRELDDIFAVQDEIAAAIGNALREKLELGADAPAHVIKAANTEAYDAYLRGA